MKKLNGRHPITDKRDTQKLKGETMKQRIPMNLQLFADGGTGESNEDQNNVQSNTQNAPQFDYEKLASIISGKQTVTEDTVLKNYFKQQGLSAEEMTSAISAFKAEKAKNTPDAAALQSQLAQANKALIDEKLNTSATLEAMALGLDSKSIPYIIKMADLSKSVDSEGKVSNEEVKKALEAVLDAIPALKGNKSANEATGGFQLGGGASGTDKPTQEDTLRNIFGIKK